MTLYTYTVNTLAGFSHFLEYKYDWHKDDAAHLVDPGAFSTLDQLTFVVQHPDPGTAAVVRASGGPWAI